MYTVIWFTLVAIEIRQHQLSHLCCRGIAVFSSTCYCTRFYRYKASNLSKIIRQSYVARFIIEPNIAECFNQPNL